MSVKTDYICDRCGRTQEKSDQFWVVGITIRSYDRPGYAERPSFTAQWCRSCMETVELLGTYIIELKKPDDPAPPTPLTFEEQIREIVREEIANQ